MRVIGICVFLYLYVHANCMVCKALKVKIKEGKYFKAIVYRECKTEGTFFPIVCSWQLDYSMKCSSGYENTV